ncbi:hypothetical protein LWI29_037465 [Acer saccharum]|uniref:Uncharacterized protein n=1 Tax=Acer saccharum TaxID=4024 RepID=A0AA39T9F9_ACESA|nr:hypothetical protein LWI29_037465 [Acer saccharum]
MRGGCYWVKTIHQTTAKVLTLVILVIGSRPFMRGGCLGLFKNISGGVSMVNSGIYVDPTSGMEDGEMKILEVGNSDRKMESSVHDMRRRASSCVPDPPNSIKRSLEFDEEAVETRASQIIDENVESPKHQSKKGRGRNRGCSQKSHRMQTRDSKVGEKSSQMCQFEQRDESESIKKGWNLEVEITKEIEKGAALGVDFKTNDGVSNDNDHWSVDEEIAKVIETGTALGHGKGCNSHEKVILEIRNWLASFGLMVVEYCPRSTNSYADILAKKGLWWPALVYGVDEVCCSDVRLSGYRGSGFWLVCPLLGFLFSGVLLFL